MDELIGHVFPTLVIPECLEWNTKLLLSIGLELLECIKCLVLGLEQIHSPESRVVINEGDPVAISRVCANRKRTMEIRMHQFKQLGCSVLSGDKWMCMHLASEAGLTDRIRGGGGVKLHASDQLFLIECLHIGMIVMSKSSVPEGEIQWDSGSEVGIVGDGNGGAREVCSVAGVNGSHNDIHIFWSSTRQPAGCSASQGHARHC